MWEHELGKAWKDRVISSGHFIATAYWWATSTSRVKCSMVRLTLHSTDSPNRPINGSSLFSTSSPVSAACWALSSPLCSAISSSVCSDGSGPLRSGCLSLIFGIFSFLLRAIVDSLRGYDVLTLFDRRLVSSLTSVANINRPIRYHLLTILTSSSPPHSSQVWVVQRGVVF